MPTCGAKTPDNETKHIQRAVRITSYCATALDNAAIMALNDLAASQASAKQSTKDALVQLLNYLSTHPNAKIRCYESPMMLQMHRDTLHLSASKARSRAVGFFFLSDHTIRSNQSKLSDTIHVLCKIIKSMLRSAAESEISAAFLNTHEATPMKNVLEEIGHK